LISRNTNALLSIQAAVLRRAGSPLHIEPLEMEAPRDDEILVKLLASGICHTDIGFWQSGGLGAVVLGHEGAGIVERVGKSVKSFRRGDHVVLSYQSCGHCRACKSGSPANCAHFWDANFGFARLDGSNALYPSKPTAGLLGTPLQASGVRGHFFGQSSFASHCLATERNLVRVSKTLPLELLAPLGCGLQTGAGTVLNSLAVRRGASIAIFGTGSVGLAAVMAAHIAGADPIIAVDIMPKRLALARELGASHSIDSRKDDVAHRIAAITGSGIDYGVETSGDAALEQTAIELLNPGGRLALLTGGVGPGHLSGGRKVLSVIQGDAVPQQFIPKMIKLYRDGKFPIDRLVTFYDFHDINRAIADSLSGKTIKPVVRMV
jgi:aryl-alcohol dehydrogenase